MKQKILIFYTSVGLGHKFIAQNIAKHLHETGYEVRLEDMLEVQSTKLIGRSQKFYFWMLNSAPLLWNWIYTTRLTYLLRPFRYWVASLHADRTKKLLTSYDPDMVISVEVNPSAIMAYLKRTGFYKKPLGISFSDPHLQHFWLYKEADFYLCNIQEQKDEIVRKGYMPADRVLVNGIPIWPLKTIPAETKNKLNIHSEKIILVSAGSLGYGVNQEYIEKLLAKIEERVQDFTLILVCGKFEALYNDLAKIKNPKLKLFGFYTPMDELYDIADVFVGKPGGLSTTECIYRRLPMVLTHWMPGGEELNVKYLTKNRLVLPVGRLRGDRTREIIDQIATELETGDFKEVLKENGDLINSFANTDPSRLANFIARQFTPRV